MLTGPRTRRGRRTRRRRDRAGRRPHRRAAGPQQREPGAGRAQRRRSADRRLREQTEAGARRPDGSGGLLAEAAADAARGHRQIDAHPCRGQAGRPRTRSPRARRRRRLPGGGGVGRRHRRRPAPAPRSTARRGARRRAVERGAASPFTDDPRGPSALRSPCSAWCRPGRPSRARWSASTGAVAGLVSSGSGEYRCPRQSNVERPPTRALCGGGRRCWRWPAAAAARAGAAVRPGRGGRTRPPPRAAAAPAPPCTGSRDSLRPPARCRRPARCRPGSTMATIAAARPADRRRRPGQVPRRLPQPADRASSRAPTSTSCAGSPQAIFGDPEPGPVRRARHRRPREAVDQRAGRHGGQQLQRHLRAAAVVSSSPRRYLTAPQRLLVPVGSGMREVEDLAGKTVCTSTGSTTERDAEGAAGRAWRS